MQHRGTGWILALALFLNLFGTAESKEPALNTLARTCPTPEALASYLKQEFTFQEDPSLFNKPDYWQEPEEFLNRKKGDCEDYAILAKTILEQQGKEAFLFSLYGGSGYAHTVCVFVDETGYSVINQDRVIHTQAGSLETLAGLLCPTWVWGAIAERSGHRGRAVSTIQHSPA